MGSAITLNRTTFQAGTASAKYAPTLVYGKFVSGSGVGNTAVTTDDPLWTLTPIPAGTLASNGDRIEVEVEGRFGTTTNSKQVGFTVAGVQYSNTSVTWGNRGWTARLKVTRVDATHINIFFSGEDVAGTGMSGDSLRNVLVADLTANTLAIVVTGASPTTGAANDVVLYSGIAELK